jgi:hypothetical protein
VIATPKGRRVISTQEYMRVTGLLRLELVVPLTVETPSIRLRAAVQSSRVAGRVHQAQHVQDTHVRYHRRQEPRAPASVQYHQDEQVVQAVLISDLDACEEAEERSKLTEAALSEVTMSKIPLFITGVSRPLQILGAVAGRPAASPHHPVISTPMMTKVARLPLLP